MKKIWVTENYNEIIGWLYKEEVDSILSQKIKFDFDMLKSTNTHTFKRRNMNKKDLWILTEERPKIEVINTIISMFIEENKFCCFVSPLRIIPILNGNNSFSFTYEVLGIDSQSIDNIYIKIISGETSFVDFLVFYQNLEPTTKDTPLYGIEETKTDDSESRNTGIFQRAIKFYFLNLYYPSAKKIMLYNVRTVEKKIHSKTNDFGTRCLLTLGVKIMGKEHYDNSLTAFTSVDDFLRDRAKVPPPKSGQRINAIKRGTKITISVKLSQPSGVFSDPNVGTVGLFASTLRILGWQHDIELINHSLTEKHWKGKSKLTNACSLLKVNIRNARYAILADIPKNYWRYDTSGEKLASIFLHVLIENFSHGFSIFENHAGSEKGYLITKDCEYISIAKKIDTSTCKPKKYSTEVKLPDLVLVDMQLKKVFNIEGEMFKNVTQGIEQLKGFGVFENCYIKNLAGYNSFNIERSVVLFGGNVKTITQIEVSFILNQNGLLIIKTSSPQIFTDSIKNLNLFWNYP